MQGDLSLFKRLWPFARPDSHLFGLALLLTPITTGLALAQPYVMKRVVDDHVTTGQLDGLQQMAPCLRWRGLMESCWRRRA